MKKWIKRTSGILLLLLVITGFINIAQKLVANDGTTESLTLKSYYLEKKDSLDIVIMGASDVMYGYCAPEVYKASGYTSFPYMFTINSAPLWKYELKEIERTQSPQLLIIETNGATYREDKYINSKHCIKMLGDNMPLSANKIHYVREMSENPLEDLIPIIKYHYRWSDFRDEYVKDRIILYKDGYSKLGGAQSYLYKVPIKTDNLYPADEKSADMNAEGEKALREFLEICKTSKIPHILFVNFPHVINDEGSYLRHQRVNRAAEIVREAGFEYLDFDKKIDEIGLNVNEDFYDEYHMLASGQRKFSNYMAEYIKEKYNIEPRKQSAENLKRWKERANMIDKFYIYYDEFTAANADNPYEEVDWNLANNKKTLTALKDVKE